MEIPRELRENLGLDDETGQDEIIPKGKKARTQSILKKNSIMCSGAKKSKKKVSVFFRNSADEKEQVKEEEVKERKPKKSVMFSTT